MEANRIGRRTLFRTVGAIALAATVPTIAACGTGTSRSAENGKSLTIRNSGGAYGDALQQAVYTPFSRETGIAVTVVNLQSPQMLAQIQQGRPQFDLIDNSMIVYSQFAPQNALEKLDFDRIKSFKAANLPSNLVTEYSVGTSYYVTLMAYRSDAFGGRKPGSWADFWDTAAFPGGRSMGNTDADLPELEFALLADGVPMDKLYPLDVDRAMRSMDRIKPSVKKFWDTGNLPGVLLSRQEVNMSTIWHGRLSALIKQGAPLAYQLSGGRRQGQGLAIARGAANIDAAYQYIDYALRPEVQANLARMYQTNPSVRAAYDKLTADERAGLPGSPEFFDKGFDLDNDWWLKNKAAVNNRWLEWARA